MAPAASVDLTPSEPQRRVRRTPEIARERAVDAAHLLLLSHGPSAVTLKGVAAATGTTHGNITHHFGSSAGLQAALVGRMAADLAAKADEAVQRFKHGRLPAEGVVDLVFSAYADTGCGRLIGWLAATGDHRTLAPVFEALEGSVRSFRADEPSDAGSQIGAGPMALGLLSHALTASLIGEALETATAMPAGSLRKLAAAQLRSLSIR